MTKEEEMPKATYKNCKYGHSLENPVIFGKNRYCRICRAERFKYEWYKTKCRRAGVLDAINWHEWAREAFGPPVKRERYEN